MMYDDEALERALADLALEETPADLHVRIMRAVSQRPEPAFKTWELWLVGLAFALCTWTILAIAGVPLFGGFVTAEALRLGVEHIEDAIMGAVTPASILWLSLGAVTAFVLQRVAGSRVLKI